MNIPEITSDMKQDPRSESVVRAQAVERPPAREALSQPPSKAAIRQETAHPEKQSETFSREKLDSLLSEVEEHFASNDVKLKFNVLEENGTIQVEIIDSDGKTIRKIPEDDLLKLSESLKNLGKGFLDQLS